MQKVTFNINSGDIVFVQSSCKDGIPFVIKFEKGNPANVKLIFENCFVAFQQVGNGQVIVNCLGDLKQGI